MDPGDELDPDVLKLRSQVREFIEYEVIPREGQLGGVTDYHNPVLNELKAKAKQAGLWALGHPKEVGGGGLSFLSFTFLNEVIGRSEWGQLALGTYSMQDSIMLHQHATEEQKQRWLYPIVAGEAYASVGLTEPEVAGSDPTLMQSTGDLVDGEWRINGHKWFTSGAHNAAFTTIYCKTDPDAGRKHEQFSAILCPTDARGYDIVRIVPTMGSLSAGICEVRYNDIRLPADSLLGERGQGFRLAQVRLGPGRIFHCMRWLGQAQRAFELMCARAKVRYAHGSLLSDKGVIQDYVAESAAEIQAARLMTLDAARALDRGTQARVEIGMIKFWVARMLHNVIDRAIQVHGGLGLTADTPLERMYREARHGRILDGPDEVHRMQVGRTILKDPGAMPWSF